jgi:hypothetical protein
MKRAILVAAFALSGLVARAYGQDTEGHGISSPQVVKSVDPISTPQAKAAKLIGEVHVSAVVLADGSVAKIRVVKSCLGVETPGMKRPSFPCVEPDDSLPLTAPDPSLGLNQAAVDAVKQWVFKPGRRYDEPISTDVTIVLEFRGL